MSIQIKQAVHDAISGTEKFATRARCNRASRENAQNGDLSLSSSKVNLQGTIAGYRPNGPVMTITDVQDKSQQK
jgi:hypothetical protein